MSRCAASVCVLLVLPLAQVSPGDAANGKMLVESRTCLDCHRIGETGSRLGPDLSEIGKLRSPELLRGAIVTPDSEVLPEHRFVRVVTKSGATVVGRLLNQDAFSIQLMDKSEQLKSYLKPNLREHTILEKGLMPSFEGKLTAQQIADIVSYLESLK
jgi:putative heme-binding domain-containing protein